MLEKCRRTIRELTEDASMTGEEDPKTSQQPARASQALEALFCQSRMRSPTAALLREDQPGEDVRSTLLVEGGTVEVLDVGAVHDCTVRVDKVVEPKSKSKMDAEVPRREDAPLWKRSPESGCLWATRLGFEPSCLGRHLAFDESMADFMYTGDA